MLLDPTTCYRAMRARDTRFDGRFFVAVSSTRIYCRPICTVKPPKRQNCRYFPSAAAAESEGYRPCLRCRPELAPGNASVDAVHRTAQAAARLLEDGSLNDAGTEAVASQLGITDRHLRRVFQSEFGVSPIAFAQTQRLLLAKRLLTDTALPITEIAFASGFSSLRRFNALFRERYRLSPRDIRKSVQPSALPDALIFQLSFRPPYDWQALLAFLDARSIAGVEEIAASSYRRTVNLASGKQTYSGWIQVAPAKGKSALQVTVSTSLAKTLPAVLARVKHLMDLSCHPTEVAQALGALAARNPGMRVPGAFDGFEVAVRAILGQQISVAAARTLAGRFAEKFGASIDAPFPALTTIFPTPARIAQASVAGIAKCGVIATRARSIIALARALNDGKLSLTPNDDVDMALEKLRALPGIGEWTAQYIAMRALAWPDAFPHTDLGIMKAIKQTNPKRVLATAEAWRPWRAYAVMHLWQSLTRGT